MAAWMLHLGDRKKEMDFIKRGISKGPKKGNGWRAPQMFQGITDEHLRVSIVPSLGIMKKKYQLTAIT